VGSSEGSGEVVIAAVDDLTVEGYDDESFGPDFDDRGDVPVGLVLGECDLFAEVIRRLVCGDPGILGGSRVWKRTGEAAKERSRARVELTAVIDPTVSTESGWFLRILPSLSPRCLKPD